MNNCNLIDCCLFQARRLFESFIVTDKNFPFTGSIIIFSNVAELSDSILTANKFLDIKITGY